MKRIIKPSKQTIYRLTIWSSTAVGIGLASLIVWRIYSMNIGCYVAGFILLAMGIFCQLLRQLFHKQIDDAEGRLLQD